MEHFDFFGWIKLPLGAVLTGIVSIVFNYLKNYDIITKILSWFIVRKYKKEQFLNDLFEVETDKVVIDFREIQVFKKYTGIYAEEKRREMLIEFHNEYQKEITWKEIKSGFSYLDFSAKKIKTKIITLDVVNFRISMIICLLLFIFGALICFYSIENLKNLNHKEFIVLIICSIFFFSMSMFIYFVQYGLSCGIKMSRLKGED